MDPDERVRGVIRLLFDKFQEFGSARQVRTLGTGSGAATTSYPTQNSSTCKIDAATAYHTVLQILGHPVYAGAYVFGRNPAHSHRRRTRPQDHWPHEADDRVECPAA